MVSSRIGMMVSGCRTGDTGEGTWAREMVRSICGWRIDNDWVGVGAVCVPLVDFGLV